MFQRLSHRLVVTRAAMPAVVGLFAAFALAIGAGLGGTTGALAQEAPGADKPVEVQASPDSVAPDSEHGIQISGGPDPFGYRYQDTNPVIGGCAFNFINIATTGTPIGTGDDTMFSGQPIGFNFTYYGTVFSTVNISTNGLMAFNTTGSSFTNTCPFPLTQNDQQISPFWDDLYVFAPSTLLRQTIGVAPNRIFVVQWNNVGFCCTSPPTGAGLTFQAQFHETSNIIAYMYLDVQQTTRTRGDSASIGIDGPGTTFFLGYSCNPVGGSLSNGLGIFFFPPGITSCVTGPPSSADLALTKTDTPDPVNAGTNLTYLLTSTNNGPAAATNVRIDDTLPTSVTFVSATASAGGSCTVPAVGSSGGTVSCTWAGATATGAGSARSVSIVVNVPITTPCSSTVCPGSPGGTISNTGTTSNLVTDPNLGNNSATAITGVRAGADVLIDPPLVTKFADSPALMSGDEPAANAPAAQGQEAGSGADEANAALPLQDPEDCIAAGDELLVTHTFSNTGPNAVTRQGDNRGPEFESVHPAQTEGLVGTCEVLAGGGVCTMDASRAQWDGEIPVGGSVTLQYRVRVKGGLQFGQIILFVGKVSYDEFNIGTNTAMRFAESEIALDCAPTVHPNTQLGCQVHLPILDFLGMDDLCETWIEVQHLGCDFAKASLVTWGEPGFCPPQAAGPLKVECTGLLKPGASWNLLGAQIPNGSKSGILFKWTAKQLSEIGVDLGFDDVVADYMCETLFFGVVGDADDYRRFKKAYNEGLEFGGVPMDLAMGGGALAVDVHRTCPGDVTPGVEVTSKYNGIAGTHLGVYDPVFGGYAYYVPLVYADKAGFTSIMYIQNGGLECTSVEVWFQEQDNCLRATICDISTLAPGETYQLDANDCVGPDFQGSAWIRTSQPTGIAVDIVGRDVLMTYIGEPAEINFTYDPDKAFFTSGNQVGFAPLIYSEYQGWDSGIQVQNLSAITAAKVKVYFLDRSGGVITTLVDWVCPRGSQTFFLPVIATLPGNWTGSARVESQEWISPGGPRVDPPNIVAIATLIKYDDAARTNTVEAIAYNLLPEHKIYDWQIGYRTGGGLESGVGLVAIPSLLKDLGGTGLTSEVAIANVVPKPGFTDFVIYIYDQNGLIDYICEKLNERQVEYIDLQTWGYVNPGFKGSAVISAIFWEHDVFDSSGRFVRNLVGLGAVVIERNSTRLGMDAPGDEAAGSRGIPFAQGITEGDDFEFCPMGLPPLCPGVPLTRRDPTECPAEATFECINCPQLIPVTGTAGPMNTALIDVDIPATCEITDIDVTLDLNHTWIGDLDVDLTSPEGTASEMFNSICGNFDDLAAILDDDAAQPIGSVCSPLGFARYTTQSGFGLDLYDGENPAGTWMLDINDLVGGDLGQLNTWSVTIQTR